jgi:hypothetical protein
MEDSVNYNDLSQLKEWFETAEEATQTARRLAERDRDYYDNYQLTEAEKNKLSQRNQPPIVINRIKPKINFLLGWEQNQRVDPKVFPRTPKHEDEAHAITDALRYVADNNRFDRIRSGVWENMLIEGFGGSEQTIEVKRDGEVEIKIIHHPWDRLFYDPYSRKSDFSDARYLGTVVWMDEEDLKVRFGQNKEALEAIEQTHQHGDVALSDTFDDRPKHQWYDGNRKRVRIVSMFYRNFEDNGRWHHCIFSSGGKLKKSAPSPFLDENGEPECPLTLISTYIDRENNRYGEVRTMIDPQDEINARRSKALHLLSMRQTMAPKGSIENVQRMKQEMSKPDGHIEYLDPSNPPQVMNTLDMQQAQFALLQEAKNEIDLMGGNVALQGKEQRDLSGRAIMAQQSSGAIELKPLIDQLRDWHLRCMRQVWNRIKQFWTEERWIRVTDDERNVRFVGINERQLEQDPMSGMMMQVGVKNEIAKLDVDIILDEGHDVVTIQSEQFAQLTQMVQAGVQIPPDILIEASVLRNKKALLERMQKNGQPSPEQQAAMQAAMQAEMEERAAKTQKDYTQATLNEAKAQQLGVETQMSLVGINAAM